LPDIPNRPKRVKDMKIHSEKQQNQAYYG